MSELFPETILNLPEADIPIEGLKAHLAQGESFQILWKEFENDITLPEHAHERQWGVVLEGKIDLIIDDKNYSYEKGDRYFIPSGVKHSSKIHAGYADITFFNQPDRFKRK